MKIRKDGNLQLMMRFGIGPLVMGGVVTPFAVIAVRRYPLEGDAWLALTLSITMMACGLGAILYGWWLDWRTDSHSDEGYVA